MTSRSFQVVLDFPGGSEVKASASNAGDLGLIPGSGRSPGERNGNPLQYSCLENPMDWGAWWAAVHEVTKSRTWLSDFTYLLTYCAYNLNKQGDNIHSWCSPFPILNQSLVSHPVPTVVSWSAYRFHSRQVNLYLFYFQFIHGFQVNLLIFGLLDLPFILIFGITLLINIYFPNLSFFLGFWR